MCQYLRLLLEPEDASLLEFFTKTGQLEKERQSAHAPWIEAPEEVFSPIQTFPDGTWPEAAEKVESLVYCLLIPLTFCFG
jgi:hypothetical protein